MLDQLVGKIVIEDHPARHEVCGIMRPQLPDHRQVLVNGRRVAYCGAKPGMPLCFIVLLPQDYIDSVREAVEAHVGGPVSKIGEVPSIDEDGNREERMPPIAAEAATDVETDERDGAT